MKKLLLLYVLLPVASLAQIQIFVLDLPDTLYPDRTYPFHLIISKKNLKTYAQLTIPKTDGVLISEFSQNAEVYPDYYLINWLPLPDGDLDVYMNLKIAKNKLLPVLNLRFIFTYLVLGDVGQVIYVIRYKLVNKTFYVLEYQGVR